MRTRNDNVKVVSTTKLAWYMDGRKKVTRITQDVCRRTDVNGKPYTEYKVDVRDGRGWKEFGVTRKLNKAEVKAERIADQMAQGKMVRPTPKKKGIVIKAGNLTVNIDECKVLKALADNMLNYDGDFGFTDEIDYKKLGYTDRQYSGYVSQLAQKDIIWVDRIVKGQVGFYGRADTCKLCRKIGIDVSKYNEFYANSTTFVDGVKFDVFLIKTS